MENMWSPISRNVYSGERQYHQQENLVESIKTANENLDHSIIHIAKQWVTMSYQS